MTTQEDRENSHTEVNDYWPIATALAYQHWPEAWPLRKFFMVNLTPFGDPCCSPAYVSQWNGIATFQKGKFISNLWLETEINIMRKRFDFELDVNKDYSYPKLWSSRPRIWERLIHILPWHQLIKGYWKCTIEDKIKVALVYVDRIAEKIYKNASQLKLFEDMNSDLKRNWEKGHRITRFHLWETFWKDITLYYADKATIECLLFEWKQRSTHQFLHSSNFPLIVEILEALVGMRSISPVGFTVRGEMNATIVHWINR